MKSRIISKYFFKEKRRLLRFALFAISVIVLIYIWGTTGDRLIGLYGKPKDAGGYGDIYGYVNSLFSGLALIFIAFTLMSQRAEIRMARKQMSDSTFFQLVELHNRNLSLISFGQQNDKNIFSYLINNLLGRLGDYEDKERPNEEITKIYESYWSHHKDRLIVYYQNIELILAFIDNLNIPEKEKDFYIKILKSQLTDHELVLLACHCKSMMMSASFKETMKKYGILCWCEKSNCMSPIKLKKNF